MQFFSEHHWNVCDNCKMGIRAGYRESGSIQLGGGLTLCGWCQTRGSAYSYCIFSRLPEEVCSRVVHASCRAGVPASYMHDLTAFTIELTRARQRYETELDSLANLPDPFADSPEPPPPPKPSKRELARLRSYGPYDWRAQAFLARPKRR